MSPVLTLPSMPGALLDAHVVARTALACLDLTTLNDADDERAVTRLCERADGPFGTPAAVCVWPRLAQTARARAPASTRVAVVANFPAGGTDVAQAVADTEAIVQAGAQEVDVVFPWRALMAGDAASGHALLSAVRAACPGLTLKVILESGELHDSALVRQASDIALACGADFLKTSTGKMPRGATVEAARVMLEAIRDSGRPAGFKASGGVRTIEDAATYLMLVGQVLGPEAMSPQRFRIGASGLLDAIEATLGGGNTPLQNAAY